MSERGLEPLRPCGHQPLKLTVASAQFPQICREALIRDCWWSRSAPCPSVRRERDGSCPLRVHPEASASQAGAFCTAVSFEPGTS